METVKEILHTKDQKRRALEIAENMIRLTLIDALAHERPKKSKINREHFHGIDVTGIEIENLKRRWHMTIITVRYKTPAGTCRTEVFFEVPPGIIITKELEKTFEDYKKIVAA